jgi:hypothetical protein
LQFSAASRRCADSLFRPDNIRTRLLSGLQSGFQGSAWMTDLKQKYDTSTVAVMRQALNEVITDRRFLVRKSVTPLEVAEHILRQAASGERDLNRLKSSAFEETECRRLRCTPRWKR